MKERNGFVTNSSSSSFVLTFKNKDDYKEFKNYCEEFNYKKFYKLIKRIRKWEKEFNEKEKNMEEALNTLFWSYARDYHFKLLDEKFPIREDNWEKRREFEKSDEYKQAMEAYLKTTDYYKKKKEIEESEIVVSGMIWDNYDEAGMLEWAIRNGFIKSEFRKWFNCQFDNG